MKTIQEILKEFVESDFRTLCHLNTDEFNAFFLDSPFEKQKDLCNEFLKAPSSHASTKSKFFAGDFFLFVLTDEAKFYTHPKDQKELHRKIRRIFLAWLINKKGYKYFSEI